MLKEQLKAFHIILASASPRRHAFFKTLDLDFEIRLHPVDEVYPEHLKAQEITDYLAKLKAEPFKDKLKPKDILITSDTIVWHNNKAVEKPKDEDDAVRMIKGLTNSTHEVTTSICFTQAHKQTLVNAITKVSFGHLSDEDIKHYVSTYKPLDKAGAYGIQEWIGAVAITHIEGSYNNVVGLPTHLLYETLNTIVNSN